VRSLAVLLVLLVASSSTGATSDLARGDAAWMRRADGQTGERALAGPVGEAIEAYQASATTAGATLESHWKLVRALWWSSEFTTTDVATRRALLDRGREASERALAVVAERFGGARAVEAAAPDELRAQIPAADAADVSRIYFWSAITLGAWSRTVGLITAVRAGVANRLHVYALRTIALDPTVDGGGAFRLLSRLHAELPRVPLLSGWVDRSEALPLAERGYAVDPEHPGNPYVLGLALLDLGGDRRAEGLRLVERTATFEPRASELVEDMAVRRDARARLALERGR